jgi:hypothetical protein
VVGARTVVVVGGTVVVEAGKVVVVVGATTVVVFGLVLRAACSREFSTSRACSCLVSEAMVAVSLLLPTVGGSVVGTCPSCDWITLAAALMSCLALTGFLADNARLASPSCRSASTSCAGMCTLAGFGCSRAPISAPPPTAPTRSVVAAATSSLARLCRRTARTADAAALTSAAPPEGNGGRGSAVLRLPAKAARPATGPPGPDATGRDEALSIASSRASANARSSGPGSSCITA